MRLLCFQAKRFWWKPFERTLPDAVAAEPAVEVRDAVVAFVHVEGSDTDAARGASVNSRAGCPGTLRLRGGPVETGLVEAGTSGH